MCDVYNILLVSQTLLVVIICVCWYVGACVPSVVAVSCCGRSAMREVLMQAYSYRFPPLYHAVVVDTKVPPEPLQCK